MVSGSRIGACRLEVGATRLELGFGRSTPEVEGAELVERHQPYRVGVGKRARKRRRARRAPAAGYGRPRRPRAPLFRKPFSCCDAAARLPPQRQREQTSHAALRWRVGCVAAERQRLEYGPGFFPKAWSREVGLPLPPVPVLVEPGLPTLRERGVGRHRSVRQRCSSFGIGRGSAAQRGEVEVHPRARAAPARAVLVERSRPPQERHGRRQRGRGLRRRGNADRVDLLERIDAGTERRRGRRGARDLEHTRLGVLDRAANAKLRLARADAGPAACARGARGANRPESRSSLRRRRSSSWWEHRDGDCGRRGGRG